MIGERYVDALGTPREVPESTREQFAAILAASAPPEAPIPAAIVVPGDHEPGIVVTLPAASWNERARWIVTTEFGDALRGERELRDAPVVESFEHGGTTYDRRRLTLAPLPEGYHRLSVDFGSFGRALEKSLTFVSQASQDDAGFQALKLRKRIEPVRGTRHVQKQHMIHNSARPQIEVDPETYAVRADGQLLVCEPAVTLPMTQRYFLF